MVRTGCWHHRRTVAEGLSAAEAWAVFRRLISKYHGRVEIVEDLGTGMTREWCARAPQQGERQTWKT